MKLFEDKFRNIIGHKTSNISMFNYLDQSSHHQAEDLRNLLNNFFKTFSLNNPLEEIKSLQKRIHGDDEAFNSTFFELMVYFILVNQGYKLETHPTLTNSPKKPDFLVTHKNGESFYLELVTAQETPSCNHIGRINDFFIQNKHANFCVITEHNNGKMKSSPKITNLEEEVFNWLNSLDPDIELLKDKHLLSSMTWHHDDFEIIIKALPLSKSQRAQGHCLYYGGCSSERIITTEQNLIKSLKKKATRYGELDAPFIIAIALRPQQYNFPLTRDIQLQTLFGKQYCFYNKNVYTKLGYSGDGLWLYNSKPQNTKNSGIWFFDFSSIFSLSKLNTNLYLNPFATYQLKSALFEFPHTVIELLPLSKLKLTHQNGIINPQEFLKKLHT